MKVLTDNKNRKPPPLIQCQNTFIFYLLGQCLTHFISKYLAEKSGNTLIEENFHLSLVLCDLEPLMKAKGQEQINSTKEVTTNFSACKDDAN